MQYVHSLAHVHFCIGLHGWVEPLEERVNELRRTECAALWSLKKLKAVNHVVSFISPALTGARGLRAEEDEGGPSCAHYRKASVRVPECSGTRAFEYQNDMFVILHPVMV